MRTILSISRDHLLLETRGAILRKSGHRVLSVSGIDEFVETIRHNQIDLVILGHSLASSDRETAYRWLKDLNCSAPVVELYATPAPPNTPAQFHLAVHDQTFQLDLLTLVKQVLSHQTN